MRVIRENGFIKVEEGDKTRVQVLKAFRNRFNVVLLRRGDAFFSVLFNHFVAATGRAPRANELFDVVFTHAVEAVGRVPRGDISFSANFIHATVGVGMGPRGDVEFSVTFTHDTAGAGRPPRELLAFVADYQHEIKAVGAAPKFVVAFAGLFTHESVGVGRIPRTVLYFDADFTHAVKGVGVAPSVPVAPLLLDQFPGAAAAYSLRKLRNDYTGAAIRVRRSSDNTEQDIGFAGNELDTAALLAFVGSGDGFVSTVYAQEGSNATQEVVSNQHRVVGGGVLDIFGLKAALRASVAGAGLNVPNYLSGTNVYTVVFVSQFIANAQGVSEPLYQGNVRIARGTNTENSIFRTDTSPTSEVYSNNANYRVSALISNGTTGKFYANTGSSSDITSTVFSTNIPASGLSSLFRKGGATGNIIHFQELILFGSDKTANINDIMNEINNYYNVY
jgi:hypothetical protein